MKLPPAYCGLYLFALSMAVAFGGAQMFSDPDTAWHLAAGDLIRSLGVIPRQDPWSYTTQGETWFNISWLFDIGFSMVFQWGGFTALYVLTALVFSACPVFMAHYSLRRGASITAVSLTLLLTLLVMWSCILARPNLCSLVFTVACYWLLARHRDSGNWKFLGPLPVILLLWANMHGGFLLAFVLMAIFFADAYFTGKPAHMRMLALVMTLSMAASLINPFGYAVYYGALKTLAGGFDKHYLSEWQAVKIGQDVPFTLLFLVMLASGGLLNKHIPLSDRLLAVMMLVLALGSVRHGPVAVLLMAPYLNASLTHILQDARDRGSRFAKSLFSKEALILQDMHKPDVKIMGLVMAGLAVVLMISPLPRDIMLKEPLGFPERQFPAKEADYILKHYPQTRFMTDYNLGGWLIYLWRGQVKVFVDGRSSSLYSKETLKDYADYLSENHGQGPAADLVERLYGFDGVVIANDDPFVANWHWNPHWKLAYKGDAASVFIRQPR